MRNIRRYRRKKQKKLIIIGSISLLLFLCVGYAAFSTNLKVMTRANIKDRHNLYVASFGSDTKGNGTKEKPYETIEKAYDSAWQNSTIYVMDNIVQKSKVIMDDNKDILLTSYSEEGSINSIIRDGSLTTNLIDVQKGILTLENITINGNDVPSQDSMINVAGEVYMERGTTVTKANNINDWSECNSNDKGGAAIFIFGDHQEGDNVENNKEGTFILNGGNIENNNGESVIWTAGIIEINSGNIINNSVVGSVLSASGKMNINNVNINNNEGSQIISCYKYINIYCNVNMYGGSIYNNSANNEIISIANKPSQFTLDGGKIMNNYTSQNGAIFIWGDGTYTYKSGVVCGNIPANQYETSTTCPS